MDLNEHSEPMLGLLATIALTAALVVFFRWLA
jgi:hypothetical protein